MLLPLPDISARRDGEAVIGRGIRSLAHDTVQRNFERRKVSLGTCARAFGTPCIHEHACTRCPMLWPDPAQRPRLVEIHDNLIARIAEAEREGWLGEVEGLQVSLAGANDKLAQLDRRARNAITVDLDIPAFAKQR
jgi:hypothetical protein